MRRWKLLVLSMVLTSHALAGNWPQFRGAQASGLDTSAAAPVHWNVASGENVRWRTQVAGLAHSSPILWGDRVFLTTATASARADLKVGLYGDIGSADDQGTHQWHLLALDQGTGKVLWDKVEHEAVPRVKRHPKSSHCSSTPATDGSHIVAIFGSEGLFCFDMEGSRLWSKDLGPMDSGFYVVRDAQWGFASSPVIKDGKVIVLCDVQTNSFVACFNLTDGKEVWRTPRTDVPTWGTPAVVDAAGQIQVLVNGWHHTGSYDFATGKEIWSLDGGGDIPVPTPIVANGLAYFTSAHGQSRPIRAIRLNARGNITPADPGATNAAIAWAHARRGNYMQTPIVVGDHLYACFDTGVLTCFDAQTGAVQYSERLGGGAEGFSSSPVSDGRNIYFGSELGHVFVVPAGKTFSIVATNALDETCMATPALSAGTLFYRTREQLVAIGGTTK
jgi:outer membrane protein assembly factor BamB